MGYFYLLVFLFISCLTIAQENLLHKSSNYSPSTSVAINPATTVDSRTYFDMTFMRFDIHGLNDFTKLDDFSLSNLRRFNPIYDFSEEDKFLYGNATFNLFSMNLSLQKHAIGFGIKAKSFATMKNIDGRLLNLVFNGFNVPSLDNQSIDVNNAEISFVSYAEVSATYSTIIKQRKKEMYLIGITPKYLLGFLSGYFFLDQFTFQPRSGANKNLLVRDFNAQLKSSTGFSIKNSGVGLDLGFMFKKTFEPIDHYRPYTKYGSCIKSEYNYKFGVSLIDLGFINFNNNMSKSLSINNISDTNQLKMTEDISDLVNNVESSFDVDNVSSIFTLMLPTALSVQFDKNMNQNVYFNATIIQDDSILFGQGPRRISTITASTRYEVDRFEAGISLSLQNYTYPSVGFSIRLWNNLTIGSDNLLPLLGVRDSYGISAYVSFKSSILWRKNCRSKRIINPFQLFSNSVCSEFRPVKGIRK